MSIRTDIVYGDPTDFFTHGRSSVMRLTPQAAIDVCLTAAEKGFLISRIEGGIMHGTKFEARLDCIWDGLDPPIDLAAAYKNNQIASEFIVREKSIHTAFVLTVPPISGWPNKIA